MLKFIIGFVIGFILALSGQLAIEKEFVRDGIAKLNGRYYKIYDVTEDIL